MRVHRLRRCASYGGRLVARGWFRKDVGGARCMQRGARVSLSNWLAFQARIRGFEDPRLLRDRPSDGAALAAKMHVGGLLCAQVMAGGWLCGDGFARMWGHGACSGVPRSVSQIGLP